ncbi:hypothetical protein OK016_22030 [Vibrio chagasii]|nr:hypothetical protein [Vibrio chagasii]
MVSYCTRTTVNEDGELVLRGLPSLAAAGTDFYRLQLQSSLMSVR